MTRVGFLLFYLLGMLPTYILPYFGSNSVIAQGVSALAAHSGLGLTGTVLHIGALVSLVYVAYARSAISGKKILVAFPVVAAVFDMVPGLSLIPLVPTVLHTIALVLGFGREDAPSTDAPVPTLAKQPMLTLLGIYCVSAAIAVFMFVTAMRQTTDAAKQLFGAAKHLNDGHMPSSPTWSPANLTASSTVAPVPAPLARNPTATVSAQPFMRSPVVPSSPVAPPPPSFAGQTSSARSEPGQAAQVDGALLTQAARDAAIESKRVAAVRDAEQAKKDAAAKRAAEVNAILIAPATQAMAKRYLESFVAFASAGELPQAVALYAGSADDASAIQVFVSRAKNGLTAEYDTPVFNSRGTARTSWESLYGGQGTLSVSVRLTAVGVETRDWQVRLTLDENNRFKAVP